MDKVLGLPCVADVTVVETFEGLTCSAKMSGDVPICSKCSSPSPAAGHGSLTIRIRDTPMRGKPTMLEIKRRRFRCRCGAVFSDPMPFIENEFPRLSHRLARYIENQAFRRPISHVAAEVGVSEAIVRRLVTRLADRLCDHHRFPTPTVFGIDDLRIRGKLFTVLTDGRSGHAIGLVEGGKEAAIRKEMRRRGVDPAGVQIVVSDLGLTNIAVVKHHFKSSPVIHVADKWHVLKGVQEALSLVINQEIDRLRRRRAWWEKWLKQNGRLPKTVAGRAVGKAGNLHPLQKFQDRIATLRDTKKHLMGARIKPDPSGQLQLYPRELIIAPILRRYPRIGKAFFTKIRLHKVYARQNRAQADTDIDLFLHRASSASIQKEMKTIVERVKTHRNLILNYYDALATNAPGVLAIPTNGPTERRNGAIRAAWRSSRGIKALNLLTMRALYEPWHIDVDIALCGVAGCNAVEGPFPGLGKARRQRIKSAGHIHRCVAHP